MANLAVIGTHWGDEGKGKVVDLLGDRFDVVARFQGGHNAGHSVEVEGRRYAFHLVPSGILRAGVTCLLGNGVVIDPEAFLSEVEGLRREGVTIGDNLLVSERAHVIASWHRAYERELEEAVFLGTTRRGIGPAYACKAERSGIRVVDLLDVETLGEKVRAAVEMSNRRLASQAWFERIDVDKAVAELGAWGERLRPFVRDTSAWLDARRRAGAAVLFEGAQATLLDVDLGTYPYVTSSSSCASGISAGLGIGPRSIDGVLGVAKAYTTRVGAGPMPTELKDATGELIRERGREFGVSTGRARRCGWFDAVAGRYSVRVNGMELAALTLLDVLDVFEDIPVAVAYRTPKGDRLRDFPADTALLGRVTPEYVVTKGWKQPLTGVRSFDDLPQRAKDYIARLEDELEVRFAIVSVGSDRAATIVREELLARWPRLGPAAR